MPGAPEPLFKVAVCSRNRPDHLSRTLAALLGQDDAGFEVLVVDQSEPEHRLERAIPERVSVVHDAGRGLSRARNIAARLARAEWLVFVDDDCPPNDGWASGLRESLEAHPEASFVSGRVEGAVPEADYLPVSTSPVDKEALVRGRWIPPWRIGLGAFMAVRSETIERLGGWDERFGPGAVDFPAADDTDFNYRLLRSGGMAYLTPRASVTHEQWRTSGELAPLYRGYIKSWSAFSMKHLREGDVLGGLWLWQFGLRDVLRLAASAVKRRSGLRLKVSAVKLQGLIAGTARGLARSW